MYLRTKLACVETENRVADSIRVTLDTGDCDGCQQSVSQSYSPTGRLPPIAQPVKAEKRLWALSSEVDLSGCLQTFVRWRRRVLFRSFRRPWMAIAPSYLDSEDILEE